MHSWIFLGQYSSHSTTEEYAVWYEKHQEDCQANYKGSTGKVETDAGKEMFARLIPFYGKPYVHYVEYGDCKTHKGIADSDIYKELNIQVEKKQCICHVQKRMNSCLRNVVKTKKVNGSKKCIKWLERSDYLL